MTEEIIQLNELENKIQEKIMTEGGYKYKKRSMRVSELPYCHRKSYIYRKYDLTPKLNGKMLSGSMFHNKLEELLKGIPEFEGADFEVPCEENLGEFKLRGRADVVKNDNVYEFKYSASKLKGDLPAYYLMQGNTYANMLNRENYILSFVNCYSLKPRLFKLKADKEAYSVVLEDAKKLYNCIKEGNFPDGPKWDWECRYCSIKNKCKELREKEEYKDLPEIGVVP